MAIAQELVWEIEARVAHIEILGPLPIGGLVAHLLPVRETNPTRNGGPAACQHGAVNLEGWEGGFLCPKLPVTKDADEIVRLVDHVKIISEKVEVEILSVDVDTSTNVQVSTFEELVRFPANPGREMAG